MVSTMLLYFSRRKLDCLTLPCLVTRKCLNFFINTVLIKLDMTLAAQLSILHIKYVETPQGTTLSTGGRCRGREKRERSSAHGIIGTHDILITRHALDHCASTSALLKLMGGLGGYSACRPLEEKSRYLKVRATSLPPVMPKPHFWLGFSFLTVTWWISRLPILGPRKEVSAHYRKLRGTYSL